jgi:outer membrane protein OmpA-like peptidoglycan-associated protein
MLVPIERGQSVRLNTVVVGTGKNALNPSSLPELDKVVAFLEANPKVKIEIGSHSEAGVKAPTLNQARAVANYITSKGISKNRVTARGYGSTRPLASNKTPEGKTLNRRIEFTITDK